jgi:N-acetylglucosamine-6-sulfatase
MSKNMKGRAIAIILSFLVMVLIGVQCSHNSDDSQPFSKASPNIILILTDDHRWDSIDYMATVQSELIGAGVEFTNAFVTTPLCCPSRASILTGLYAHNHGVWINGPPKGGAGVFDDSSTVAIWLQDAGYKTALVGKYLNGYASLSPYIPPGWDDWFVFVNPAYYNYSINDNGVIVDYGKSETDYSTDVLVAKALDYIQNSDGQPFFLYFSPYAPHPPGIPAPRHRGLLDNIEPWRPPSYNEEDVSDKPAWVQGLGLLDSMEQSSLDNDRRKELESLFAVDEAIAAMLQAIRDIGQEENTVIFFMGDNGLSWGEHRWTAKDCGYEECIRVPFAFRDFREEAVPRQDSRFVLNIDLAPTFADLAGITVPSGVDGMSLVPLLNSESVWRQDILIEHWPGSEVGRKIAITEYGLVRNDKWKYIEYVTGETELYNIIDDPLELTNVAADPSHASIIADLDFRLQQLKAEGTGLDPIFISSNVLPNATQGVIYNTTIGVSGGASPYLWEIVTGALPNGMILDADTGVIAGIPTVTGDFTFGVRVKENQESWDTAILSIRVNG